MIKQYFSPSQSPLSLNVLKPMLKPNESTKWIRSTVSQTTICENHKVKVMKSVNGKEYTTSISESTNVSYRIYNE